MSRGLSVRSRHADGLRPGHHGLDPGNAWAIAGRSETHWQMRRQDEGPADYTQGPGRSWPYGFRQVDKTNWLMEHYDEALTDYTRGTEPRPNYRPPQDRGFAAISEGDDLSDRHRRTPR